LVVNVNDSLSILGAVFDGDAAGPGSDDPQQRNRHGTNFRINDPPLLLGQVQYSWNNRKGDPRLAGTIKLGGWRHFGGFADERYATDGSSLLDRAGSGTPATLSGDYGVWAVAEQQIHRVPGSDDRGVGLFARVSSSPSDRNLVDLYADGGIEFIGPSDARANDKFGFAIGYAHVSKQARALDLDYRRFLDAAAPIRSSETLFTAAYQYEVKPGWSVQPNFQYIVHPAGGATNPVGPNPGRALKNAAVMGIRTVVKF
jgi:porin